MMHDRIEDKLGFLELNLRKLKGFSGVEYSKQDGTILTKNHSYNGMIWMVCHFNNNFKENKIKLTPKKYYKLNGTHISSRDFKILNVPRDLNNKAIEQGIRKLLNGKPFFIKQQSFKKRNESHNTIFFIVRDECARNIVKNSWSIEIYTDMRQHISLKKTSPRGKKYRTEFEGFDASRIAAKAMEVLVAHNPMNAYKQSPTKIIVEFNKEHDLFNACRNTFNFGKHKIKGIPVDYNWVYINNRHRQLNASSTTRRSRSTSRSSSSRSTSKSCN